MEWFKGSGPLFKNNAKGSRDVQIRLRVVCLRQRSGLKKLGGQLTLKVLCSGDPMLLKSAGYVMI